MYTTLTTTFLLDADAVGLPRGYAQWASQQNRIGVRGRGVPGTPSDGSLYPPEVRPHVGMILWDQGGSIPRIKISKSPNGDLYTTIFDPIYDFF